MVGRAVPRRVAIGCLVVAALLGYPAVAAAGVPTPGSEGLGDPYFPKAGNGGYTVSHYDLRLHYSPGSDRLEGHARIQATTTQDLSRFDLDLRGFDIHRVRVNGDDAAIEHEGQELMVTPDEPIADGEPLRVRVNYSGKPKAITDPDGSKEGWLRTPDGAVALNEPVGSPSWYPCNDYPTDKATYRFRVVVPRGLVAVANGVLVKRRHTEDRTAFIWSEREPMATYLSTVAIGEFDLERTLIAGIPAWFAIDPERAAGASNLEQQTRKVLRFLPEKYGEYPFSATGGTVDQGPPVGYALETQTRPFYPSAPGTSLVVHELAHQWFGDSVTLSSWPEIWLNEGFAQWSEWFWAERHGGPSAQHKFNEEYATPASDSGFWNPPPGDPGGPQNLFDHTIYVRGAMTLQALREKVGNATFMQTLRDWTAQNRYGNVTTPDFIALAEQNSGDDLDVFFDAWLYEPGKPPNP